MTDRTGDQVPPARVLSVCGAHRGPSAPAAPPLGGDEGRPFKIVLLCGANTHTLSDCTWRGAPSDVCGRPTLLQVRGAQRHADRPGAAAVRGCGANDTGRVRERSLPPA